MCRKLKMFRQQGRRRKRTRGIPSGVRYGFFFAENTVAGHFQHATSDGASDVIVATQICDARIDATQWAVGIFGA